jgi:hypothetical protein
MKRARKDTSQTDLQGGFILRFERTSRVIKFDSKQKNEQTRSSERECKAFETLHRFFSGFFLEGFASKSLEFKVHANSSF